MRSTHPSNFPFTPSHDLDLSTPHTHINIIFQVTVFLTSMENFAEMNGVYEKYFGATKPSRSCVAVKELPRGVPVEMECIALSGSA